MDPNIAREPEVWGDIRLKFRAYTGRAVIVKRKILLSATNKATKFESLEQILQTRGDDGGEVEINHHCAEIEKQVP